MILIEIKHFVDKDILLIRTAPSVPLQDPAYYVVDMSVYTGTVEEAVEEADPDNTDGFTNATNIYLQDWANDLYKNRIKAKSNHIFSCRVNKNYDLNGMFGFLELEKAYPSNAVAMAMIQAVRHFINLVWSKHQYIRISLENSIYMDEHNIHCLLCDIPSEPVSYYEVQFECTGVGFPAANRTEQYYLDWITNNPI